MEKKRNYYTPAQKRAQAKYNKEKLSQVRFWVKKEEKLAIQQEAKAHGMSMRRYIAQAINTMAGQQLISLQDSGDEQETTGDE